MGRRPAILSYYGRPRMEPARLTGGVLEFRIPARPVWPSVAGLSGALLGCVGISLGSLLLHVAPVSEQSPREMAAVVSMIWPIGVGASGLIVLAIVRQLRFGHLPTVILVTAAGELTLRYPGLSGPRQRQWRRDEIDHLDVQWLGRSLGGGTWFNLRIFTADNDLFFLRLPAAEHESARHLERDLCAAMGLDRPKGPHHQSSVERQALRS